MGIVFIDSYLVYLYAKLTWPVYVEGFINANQWNRTYKIFEMHECVWLFMTSLFSRSRKEQSLTIYLLIRISNRIKSILLQAKCNASMTMVQIICFITGDLIIISTFLWFDIVKTIKWCLFYFTLDKLELKWECYKLSWWNKNLSDMSIVLYKLVSIW